MSGFIDNYMSHTKPLTPRTASAPSLVDHLTATPENLGPSSIDATRPSPSSQELDDAARLPPNSLQEALTRGVARLPKSGTDPILHVKRVGSIASPLPVPATAGEAGTDA
ncbi:hypothetical protein [Acetobacter fallax]|uniref:Uncharacterized protein n=1 Tax=Acetobacter fallax TaxID=1737473 RepID=A0ABX0K687_9PROT|nr:hypothetical protein [Acetobacter fallax]NHO31900.1 hypothetical protein [Acetobacter fallax]NHO35337.1 hypothetical protein [Acetobacter fallax]